MNLLMVYCPISNFDDARRLSRLLLKERLIACANYWPIHSLYHWDNELQEDQEVVIIMKTSADKKDAVKELIESNHPYDCPCILFLKPEDCNSAFTNWVSGELA